MRDFTFRLIVDSSVLMSRVDLSGHYVRVRKFGRKFYFVVYSYANGPVEEVGRVPADSYILM